MAVGVDGGPGRRALVAAAVGGQSCWPPVLRTANPAAWMWRCRSAPRSTTRSASPRWNWTWRSVASWGCRECWWRPELGGEYPFTVSPGSGAIAHWPQGAREQFADATRASYRLRLDAGGGRDVGEVLGNYEISALMCRRWCAQRRWLAAACAA